MRRKDEGQLARMQTAIDLLVNLHTIRAYLSASGNDRIQTALKSSPDAQLTMQAHQIEALAAIQADRFRADGLLPCALYDKFVASVEELCHDPLAAALDDLEDASIISDRLVRAMLRYSSARAQINIIAEDIASAWSIKSPDSEEDLNITDGILLKAAELDGMLSDDDMLTVADAEGMADECASMFDILHEIYDRYADGADSSRHDSDTNELEEALKFFGFSPDSPPLDGEIKKVFRELWKQHNVDDPSHRETETQRLENERILKEINKYMQCSVRK
jgi:hypothetical protein